MYEKKECDSKNVGEVWESGKLIEKTEAGKFLSCTMFNFHILCNENFIILNILIINIQGEAHKVLQSDSTQTIDYIQKCFRQKFQCLRK